METLHSKIFLVDDNLTNLAMGRNMLKDEYEVFPATSAAKLFALLEHVRPDLILLDIEMPETDGYETIKKLKANPDLADIPVIFLSAKSNEGNALKGFELGAADYISKPLSGPVLLKRIANQLLIVQLKRELRECREGMKN
ncbi:MAG: response regulator [Treponema sp.]|nr:response regulator [Treponema sp.]